MTGEQPGRQSPSAGYQIRLRGHLGATTLRAFPALQAETRDQDTLLQGVTDQAALHGVLAQVEALGLELLEVRRLPESKGAAQVPGRARPESPGRA
jgi:hypothetical protein